jgi:hypothetical protein
MVYTDSDGFDWDEENVRHIQLRHGIDPEEVELAFDDERRYMLRTRSTGESRWQLIAATPRVRVLSIIFTRRRGRIRIVTARDADARERRLYRQAKR